MVVGARQKIHGSNHLILTPGRVVAELSFGFWIGLVGKQYDHTLWVPHLHRAFPHAKAVTTSPSGEKKIQKLKRSAIADWLDSIRRLRNVPNNGELGGLYGVVRRKMTRGATA